MAVRWLQVAFGGYSTAHQIAVILQPDSDDISRRQQFQPYSAVIETIHLTCLSDLLKLVRFKRILMFSRT